MPVLLKLFQIFSVIFLLQVILLTVECPLTVTFNNKTSEESTEGQKHGRDVNINIKCNSFALQESFVRALCMVLAANVNSTFRTIAGIEFGVYFNHLWFSNSKKLISSIIANGIVPGACEIAFMIMGFNTFTYFFFLCAYFPPKEVFNMVKCSYYLARAFWELLEFDAF